MEAFLQKNLVEPEFPFRLFVNKGEFLFPHHWHEEIEIIYVIEGKLRTGINEKVYDLCARDILIVRSGDIHYFNSPSDFSKKVIVQFKRSLFDSFYPGIDEKQFARELMSHSLKISSENGEEIHDEMEMQILKLVEEFNNKKNGYKLALKARIYDLAVLLLRNMNTEESTANKREIHIEKLQKLEKVFKFVEENYDKQIYLKDVADNAGFSLYHFTRFFKVNTGMTFCEYLNNYRITIAEWLLINEDYPIIEVAYKSGFSTVNSFNKVFKHIKKCSPTEYRKEQKNQSC